MQTLFKLAVIGAVAYAVVTIVGPMLLSRGSDDEDDADEDMDTTGTHAQPNHERGQQRTVSSDLT